MIDSELMSLLIYVFRTVGIYRGEMLLYSNFSIQIGENAMKISIESTCHENHIG